MNINADDIVQLAEIVWETTLALPIEPDRSGTSGTSGRCVVAVVQLTGAWSGALVLECPIDVAKHAAVNMLGGPKDRVSAEDVQDAVAELANVMAGNLRNLLPGGCFLSLPSVIEGGDYSTRISGGRVLHRVPLSCDGQRVTITIVEQAARSRVA